MEMVTEGLRNLLLKSKPLSGRPTGAYSFLPYKQG